MGESVNKKTKYFYVHIFNINNFDHDFGVTLIDFLKLAVFSKLKYPNSQF